MIRFVVALSSDRTFQTKVDGDIVDAVQPAGFILRSGYCSESTFNRQALQSDEVAVEISVDQWPVDDTKFRIDLSGEEPVLVEITDD